MNSDNLKAGLQRGIPLSRGVRAPRWDPARRRDPPPPPPPKKGS